MKRIISCLVLLLMTGLTQAQSTINATGNTKTVNGNTYSYSIGEMILVHTATANNIIVTQGVLQGNDATVGIETTKLTVDEFKVYPNPTKDLLNMQANLEEKGSLLIKLFNITGKELYAEEWKPKGKNESKQINLSSFAAGNYILNVQYNNGNKNVQQSYKIQKLK